MAIFTTGLRSQETSRRTVTLATMSNVKTALDVFETDMGRYPTTDEGLNALFSYYSQNPYWKGPYISNPPVDAWGHPFIYKCPGFDDPTSYDLISSGPDGIEGTPDDLNKFTEY